MTRLNNGIVCTIALLVAASSQAQQFSSFGSSRNGVGLTKVDSDMVSAATHQLNAKAALQPGDDQSWANPKSGHSGKITVTKLFTSDGAVTELFAQLVQSRRGRLENQELTETALRAVH